MASVSASARPLSLVDGFSSGNADPWSPDMPGDDRFPFCRGKLLLNEPDDGEVMACSRLADKSVFTDLIDRYGAKYPGADRRAVTSMWTLYYFSILTISPTVHRLVHGRQLSLGFEDLSLVYNSETGEPQAFLLPDTGRDCSDAPAIADLHVLLRDHAAPAIAVMADHSGVAPKLLWNNVAVYLNWIIKEIGNKAGPHLAQEAIDIVGAEHWPDGTRNPLFGMIRLARRQCGMDHFQRKVCCLRYNLPGVSGCGDLCPVPDGRR
ncbi:siderophore-iron reductase FhuF [Allorhizobium taibaishanense]|uniref:Ferric iron reductase protein FhuF n=1 Tax=Allorhizobium taibaishanense TaxID=887144 RepID=A0A1Q9A689_9HYPH|nr:siderophore-iron reductase FhuF [Allorhizobium taibaishanense]MBB4008777.1 ferric iron reductase protein FhuF [Allorhizobium taibaishanense]OLP50101.1 siderophore-iron reductase FhuF [Allorhizobium taibaishanense]